MLPGSGRNGMRYRRPFTPEQRSDATRTYVSFLRHVRLLRDEFPPKTRQQASVLRSYKKRVRELFRELSPSDAEVDVDELNALVHLAKADVAEYLRLRVLGDQ